MGLLSQVRIKWVSPLMADDYAEYSDEAMLRRLGVKLQKRALREFWPKGGPVWDGLATTDRGDLILVEAKSHLSELESNPTAASGLSLARIRRSMEETKHFFGLDPDIDWCGRYYQYANRLAHLYFLRELNGLPAHLCFLYFIGDKTMSGPETESEWCDAINTVHRTLGIEGTVLSDSVIDVFIDARSLEEVPTG